MVALELLPLFLKPAQDRLGLVARQAPTLQVCDHLALPLDAIPTFTHMAQGHAKFGLFVAAHFQFLG
jgi:hypothetical protein